MRGDLDARTDDELLAYLSGLSNQTNLNTGTQHRDMIRGFCALLQGTTLVLGVTHFRRQRAAILREKQAW